MVIIRYFGAYILHCERMGDMNLFRKTRRIWAIAMTMSLLMAQSVSASEVYDAQPVQEQEILLESEAFTEDALVSDESIAISDESVVVSDESILTEDAEEAIGDSAEDVSETVNADATVDATAQMMFPGLPDEYSINEADDSKEELKDHLDDMADLAEGIDYVRGQILVDADSLKAAEDYADAFNGSLESYSHELAVINLNEDKSLPAATVMDAVSVSALTENALPAAWPNYYRYLYEEEIAEPAENAVSVSDPMLVPKDKYYQWHHSMLNSDLAWQAGYTGNGIKVAVIDTGINTSHEDIETKVAYGCTANNNSPVDVNGHGSNVAGVIAMTGNNGKGGKGVAYDATLYTFNVNYYEPEIKDYTLNDAGIVDSIYNAVDDLKVDIINMSLGGPGYSGLLENAVKHAYDEGVAVICAAGNENTNALAYPAGCDGAISVAAVDGSNTKTFFSNYGGIDFSGPGLDICSAYKGNSNAYCNMSGTSQASPCIAGVAAILLSTGKVTGTGSARVENLKKLMASGCVSSGLGKGTPDLAKILKLTDTVSKPDKPTMKSDKLPGTYNEASVSVQFNDMPGNTIYYTLDGKNVSYKDGRISDGAIMYDGSAIVLTGAEKVTVKAIAVNDTNKLASAAASYTYVLKPKVGSIRVRSQSGAVSVIKGGKLQMEAVIVPDHAANKKVEWSIEGSPSGITVTNSGLVKVDKSVSVAGCTVTAKAADGSNVSGTFAISIKDTGKIKSIKASKNSFTLYSDQKSGEIDVTVKDVNNTQVSAAENLSVSSQDPQIANAVLAGNKLTVNTFAPGKTRISLAAADGSAAVCVISVTVKQAVTGIDVKGPVGGKLSVGRGFKPTVTYAPEDAALKKLDWKLETVPSGTTEASCGVKVNPSSGAVSVSKTAATGQYTVKATAKDGSGVTASYSFAVINSSITGIETGSRKERIFRVKNAFDSPTSAVIQFKATGITAENNGSISVTSSNPEVAYITDVSVNSGSGEGSFRVVATGNSTGNVNVTIASADGTNIKKTIKVSVVNPPSAIRVLAPKDRALSLAKGKTMKLKVIAEEGYGKVDAASKKCTFVSSRPDWISVNPANGTAKGEANQSQYNTAADKYDPAVITATTTDGSEAFASINITPCTVIKKITAGYVSAYGYPVKGSRVWISQGNSGLLLGMLTGETGTVSGRYKITVNKSGLGVKPKLVDGYYGISIVGNKKGRYSVKLTPTDGNGGGCSWSVEVR